MAGPRGWIWAGVLVAGLLASAAAAPPPLERVTTMAPFPRGLVMAPEGLYVLCRGRVRSSGGVSAAIDDQAGTIYLVDPALSEPWSSAPPSARVQGNGRVFARPTAPPFRLWQRTTPAEADRETDRPYCTLRWHAASQSLLLCAFSGVDKPSRAGDPIAFSKNLTDGLLRYDLRSRQWSEVERHRIEAGGSYPHHDVRHAAPPHGWLKGPDNCLVVGDWLYAVAKDNSRLVRYDLRPLVANPAAPPPPSFPVLEARTPLADGTQAEFYGHSALAEHDGWLYVGCRTSSVIFRLRLTAAGLPVAPPRAEVVAWFDAYDPRTGRSANLTDMAFDPAGRLYVVSAQPARVFRFTPDPRRAFDARADQAAPWVDLAARVRHPQTKCENVLYADGWIYLTTGDGYAYQQGAEGTVYRVQVTD